MLSELLKICPGVTAIIGSGGKTSLIRAVGEKLAAQGHTVILTTTTHICPFHNLINLQNPAETELARVLKTAKLVCVGALEEKTGKLTESKIPMETLASLADFVLAEADGSHQLPLKAHGMNEPVIPKAANQTICVVGISGLGMPIEEVVHRPEIFSYLTGAKLGDSATIETVARALNAENLAERYYLNQADDPEKWAWAKALAEELNAPAVAGSLQRGAAFLC